MEQNSPTRHSLNSVQFINENTGWAAGDSGIIIHTTDGGVDWTKQESNYSRNIKKILFADSLRGWCLGSDSTILKTSGRWYMYLMKELKKAVIMR